MDDLRLIMYKACTFYYGTIDYLKPWRCCSCRKSEGSVPRLHGMIAESGLRYRGALRLTVVSFTGSFISRGLALIMAFVLA